jgi:hypothetical protein
MPRSNWHRYPLSEHDFRTAYGALSTAAIVANANDVRFLPLLFVVLAIAVRLAPENIAGDERTRRLTSLRYYWSCAWALFHETYLPTEMSIGRSCMLISAAIQPDSIEMVLTRLLVSRFNSIRPLLILSAECALPNLRPPHHGVLESAGRCSAHSTSARATPRRWNYGRFPHITDRSISQPSYRGSIQRKLSIDGEYGWSCRHADASLLLTSLSGHICTTPTGPMPCSWADPSPYKTITRLLFTLPTSKIYHLFTIYVLLRHPCPSHVG